MYSYQKEDVSIKTVLDTRRALSDGLYRVRIRVFYQGKYWEYSTGKKTNPKDWKVLLDWEKLEAQEKRSLKKLKSIRNDIQITFDLIKKHVKELIENEQFSFEALNSRLQRNDSETLNNMLQQKIDALGKENRYGTQEYYTNIKKAVERYKGESIKLVSVNAEWLKGFEQFLLNKEKTYTTVGMYARGIRHIMNLAIEKGSIKMFQYPFAKNKYEIPTGSSRKLALTIEQVGEIVNFSDGNPGTEKYRDLWFFAYMCNGININDLLKLKYSNIIDGEFHWYRQKTINTNRRKKQIQAYITPEMEAIIKKWGNPPEPENYIFPFLQAGMTEKRKFEVIADVKGRIRRKMKTISEDLGLVRVNIMTARHSFATVLKRSGTSLESISESLGHADLKTTENYLASFEKRERAKNAALLTNFKTNKKSKKA
jgi:integrase/recombinase XerD